MIPELELRAFYEGKMVPVSILYLPQLYSNSSEVEGNLGQAPLSIYTGVKLSNETKIFSRDILAIPDTDTEFVHGQGSGPTYPINHLAEVLFKDGCFGVMITNRNGDNFPAGFLPLSELMRDSRWPEVEIIGNSLENPEYVK